MVSFSLFPPLSLCVRACASRCKCLEKTKSLERYTPEVPGSGYQLFRKANSRLFSPEGPKRKRITGSHCNYATNTVICDRKCGYQFGETGRLWTMKWSRDNIMVCAAVRRLSSFTCLLTSITGTDINLFVSIKGKTGYNLEKVWHGLRPLEAIPVSRKSSNSCRGGRS